MRLQVRKVAVLGSGVMGSAIAAHFANAGIPSLVLDIVPDGAGADHAGLDMADRQVGQHFADLLFDKAGLNPLDIVDSRPVRDSQTAERRAPVHPPLGLGFKVGRDAGPARGVSTGTGQRMAWGCVAISL